MRRLFDFTVLMIVLYFMVGCAPPAKIHKAAVREAYEIQKPIEVRTSKDDDRPTWTKVTMGESDGIMYFSGGFTDGVDYALTVRSANAEALKNAIGSISSYIRSEFSGYVQGSNSALGSGIERYVSDGIATFTENIHVQGIKQAEVYYEEMFSPTVMQITYNAFVRLEISKAEYLHAKAEVLRRLRDKFSGEGQVEAKEKAENLLKDLKDEVKGV